MSHSPCKCRRRWKRRSEIQTLILQKTRRQNRERSSAIPEDSDAEWDMIEEVFNNMEGKNIQCMF